MFPVLIWAALRFGRWGGATSLLITAGLTVWHTSDGSGPFVRSSLTDSLLATQLFLAVAALTSMVLAAVTAERAASEAAARGLAQEQAALRRIATLVVTEADPARVFGQVMREAARALGVASASLVRYEDPRRVCVMGGWSETGRLLFPVGSTIELGTENSALVEVYRTGEARRVTYPDQAVSDTSDVAADLRSHGYRSSVAAPVKLADGLWGALVASTLDERPLPQGSEQRLSDFADLVSQALANADAHDKLAASRARIVEAGDAERRRLERNLHDGAQQRLVSLALQLRLTQSALERRPDDVLGLLVEAQAELARALDELRELARGIHPAILTDRGLGPALEAIIARAPLPVELLELPEERLPEQVEAAVYYVVAETITNIAKHAQAESATVAVTLAGSRARVVITDNGIGGADPDRRLGPARPRRPHRGARRRPPRREHPRPGHAHRSPDPLPRRVAGSRRTAGLSLVRVRSSGDRAEAFEASGRGFESLRAHSCRCGVTCAFWLPRPSPERCVFEPARVRRWRGRRSSGSSWAASRSRSRSPCGP